MSPIENDKGEEGERLLSKKPEVGTPKPVEILATHTVKEDETLSHISLKYYGSAYREAWIIIYEANKDVLGGTPEKFVMRPGQVLKIPKRPA